MYYSLTIADDMTSINTYDDWRIAPKERPSFSPPSFDMQTITINGRNGLFDVTTSLTRFPTFGNRTGSFTFLIHPESPYSWYDTYSKISNYLHGQTKRISLEDDSAFWYTGRLWLSSFKTGKTYSEITIEYSVEPYKKSKWTTVDVWDDFPYELPEGAVISNYYKNLQSNSSSEWTQVFNSMTNFDDWNRQLIIGQGPTIPTLTINSDNGTGLDIWFENDELQIMYITHLADGEIKDTNIIFSMMHPNNGVRMAVKGVGKVSIKYNIQNL